MSELMNSIAAVMRDDADALRVTANNVSNANSVAYRRQVQVTHLDFASVAAGEHNAALSEFQLPQTQVTVDTRTGTLRNTGEPLNVALQGNGYFVVDTAQGEMLTRRGDFHIDESGVLSAFTGDPVLGTEGALHVPAGTVQIAADGTITVGTATVGHLRVVQPESGVQLSEASNGLLTLPQGQEAAEATAMQIHQGFLETSNVQPVTEMMHLMESIRHFESGQRYVRAYDDMLDKAINDLGQI
jgi:flagellar basal-body rod protein FlgF